MIRILVIACLLLTSSCAVFDGGKVPKTTLSEYVDDGNSKPTLSYSSIAMSGLSSAKELPEASQSIIEGELFLCWNLLNISAVFRKRMNLRILV